MLMAFASVQQLIRDASVYARKTAPEEDLNIQGGDPGSSDNTELNTGLRLLNELITINNIRSNNVALLSNEQVTVQITTNQLELTGWSKLLKVRYLLGNRWIDIPFQDLNTYLDQEVVANTSGVPYTSYRQRTDTGITLKYYFPVNEAYLFDIWGYKYLPTFENLSDPIVGFSKFHELYFLYELAYKIAAYYQIPPSDYVIQQRNLLQDELRAVKEKRIDIKVAVTSQMGSPGAFSPQALSMMRGYTP